MPDAVIKLKAVDEASGVFERAAQNIGKQLRAMRAEANESGETALHKMLSGGPDKVLEGALGAAGMGVQGLLTGFIGEQAEQFSDKMVEMRNQLAEGNTSAAELVDQFVRAVPILGNFYATAANIRELITGEKQDMQEQNEQTSMLNTLYDTQARLVKQIRDDTEKHLDVLRQIRNEEALIGKMGPDREKEMNRQTEEQSNTQADRTAYEAKQKYQEGFNDAREKLVEFNKTHGQHLSDLQQMKQEWEAAHPGSLQVPRELLELPDLQQQAQQLQTASDAARRQLEKASADADAQAAATKKENSNRRQKADADADRRAGIDRIEAARQTELQVADMRAKAQEEGLERNREFLKSHLIGLMTDYNKQVSDINAAADKSLREDSGDVAGIEKRRRDMLDAAAEKYGQDIDSATHQEKMRQNDEDAHAAQVNDQLAKGRIESLRAEAAMGNLAAGMEAQRLEIQTKYNEKREEYNRILRDEAATLAQKAQAQKQLTGLDQQEQLALLLANTPSRGFMLNPMQEVGRTTGVAARAREENDPLRQQLVQAREAAMRAEQQRKSMIDILAMVGHALTSGGGTPPRMLTGSRVR